MTAAERVTAKQAARQATETALLEAATQLLLESPQADLLRAVKPVDVVRRAVPERTTGAFYNIWPTQADFRQALLRHVLSLDRFPVDLSTRALIGEALTRPDVSLPELVRLAANLNFDGLKDEPAIRLQQALWTQSATDPEVRDGVKGLYGAISASLLPVYAGLLERFGRRPRSPYTVESIAVVLAALVEGLHVRWAVDPDAVPDDLGPPPGVDDDQGGRWGMFASVTYVIFMAMTEPADRTG